MSEAVHIVGDTEKGEMHRSMTLGSAAASLAGLLAAYAGSRFGPYDYYALVCFIFVIPMNLGVYFAAHSTVTSVVRYPAGTQYAFGWVIAVSAFVTAIGYALLIASLNIWLGVFFISWAIMVPILILIWCATSFVPVQNQVTPSQEQT
ncbi:hypothetical protein ACWGTI_26835 [Mesorhizobium sp. ArgA1]